jgi:uncharacterized protein DUF4389
MSTASAYPVHYHVWFPPRFARLQLLVRFVAALALAVVGLSFGSLFVFAYLALPVFAAVRLSTRTPSEYVADDGARLVRGLQWFAAVNAWFALIADRLPARDPKETVELAIVPDAKAPTPGSAMLRLITGIPSALVLGLLGMIGAFVWLWAALTILINERVGHVAFEYLEGVQRWAMRLLAYQASLVDEYPPYSFDDGRSTCESSSSGAPNEAAPKA